MAESRVSWGQYSNTVILWAYHAIFNSAFIVFISDLSLNCLTTLWERGHKETLVLLTPSQTRSRMWTSPAGGNPAKAKMWNRSCGPVISWMCDRAQTQGAIMSLGPVFPLRLCSFKKMNGCKQASVTPSGAHSHEQSSLRPQSHDKAPCFRCCRLKNALESCK